MRWLLIVLLVSLAGLLFAAAGVAYHVWKQHRQRGGHSSPAPEPAEETDLEVKR